jgi:hypothetical protein
LNSERYGKYGRKVLFLISTSRHNTTNFLLLLLLLLVEFPPKTRKNVNKNLNKANK